MNSKYAKEANLMGGLSQLLSYRFIWKCMSLHRAPSWMGRHRPDVWKVIVDWCFIELCFYRIYGTQIFAICVCFVSIMSISSCIQYDTDKRFISSKKQSFIFFLSFSRLVVQLYFNTEDIFPLCCLKTFGYSPWTKVVNTIINRNLYFYWSKK